MNSFKIFGLLLILWASVLMAPVINACIADLNPCQFNGFVGCCSGRCTATLIKQTGKCIPRKIV